MTWSVSLKISRARSFWIKFSLTVEIWSSKKTLGDHIHCLENSWFINNIGFKALIRGSFHVNFNRTRTVNLLNWSSTSTIFNISYLTFTSTFLSEIIIKLRYHFERNFIFPILSQILLIPSTGGSATLYPSSKIRYGASHSPNTILSIGDNFINNQIVNLMFEWLLKAKVSKHLGTHLSTVVGFQAPACTQS